MKIVIDIPEEVYKASQIIDVKYEDVIQIPLEVIANGTPLPEGHGDLIDRDEVRTNIKETCDYTGCNIGFDEQYLLKCTINNIGTVIPADKGE